MRFEQHVYGRVVKGFRTPRPGFQLAAVTELLLDRPQTIEALNRLSFCRRGTGKGPRERYSMFRPAPGRLAFGCARMAKDTSGAVGSLAHNYLCSEDDFVASGASPVSILRGLTFFAAESELPAGRDLPPLERERFDAPARSPQWHAAALNLIDVYLGESAVVVPMVILDTEESWRLLDEIFSLLPRQEAARLTFSTLFVEATDCLDAYRLVLIPNRDELPRDASVYRVVQPSPGEDLRAARRRIPWTDFWRSHPRQGESLCRWVDLMRRSPGSPEIPALLGGLLATESPFRRAVEALDVKGIYAWLVRKPEWLASYHQAGGALDFSLIRDAVWPAPESRLLPVMEGGRRLGERELIALLCEDLGRRIASGALDTQLAALLHEHGQLSPFFEAVSDAHRFDDDDLISLAERLSREPFYRGELHQAVARRVLSRIAEGRRSPTAEPWIASRAGQDGGDLFSAIAALIAWRDASIWRRDELSLASFERLPRLEYPLLLSAVWTVARNAKTFVRMVFRDDAREALFAFCARGVSHLEMGILRDLLAAVAVCPWGSEHGELIDAILDSPKAYELAKHYAACLERSSRPDSEAIARLRNVRRPQPGLSKG